MLDAKTMALLILVRSDAMRRFVMASAVFVAAFGLARADDAEKATKEVEGTYTVKSLVKDGKPAPKEFLEQVESVEIKGGTITLKMKQGEQVVKFKLDPSKKPAAIDITKDENGKPKEVVGIYKFEKGELTIATVEKGDRPKEFKSENGGTLLVFVKKDK